MSSAGLKLTLSWRAQSSLKVPAMFQPQTKAVDADFGTASPLGQAVSVPVEGNQMIATPIVSLLTFSAPFNVSRLVASGVVNTVDAVFGGWSPTDVGQERLVAITPSVTDGDSASTVLLVGGMGRLQAAGLDTLPRSVFGGSLNSRFSVSKGALHVRVVDPIRSTRTAAKTGSFASAGDDGKSLTALSPGADQTNSGRILTGHRKLTPFGDTPRAVDSSAVAFACSDFTMRGLAVSR